MSLLFNTLSTFVIAFLSRSKRLLISWLQSLSTVILEPKKIKSLTVFFFSYTYLPWSDGTRCHKVFWMLSFKLAFLLSPFTFIKRLFSSYLLSARRVVSSAYLRLLVFLQAPIRMTIIKMTRNKCWCYWWGCGEKGKLVHCSHYRKHFWVWRFLKRWEIKLSYDSTILLLSVSPKGRKSLSQIDIFTPMITAALFTRAKRWKQPKCPLMNG